VKDGEKNVWDEKKVLKFFTSAVLSNYKQSLTLSHTPAATINRRLTTLRNFFSFAENAGYIIENPTAGLTNVSQSNQSLSDENLDTSIKLYEQNQREFHEWVETDSSDIHEFFRWYKDHMAV
jgi:site-specific recombinase XerD